MDENTRVDRARAKGRTNLLLFVLLIGLGVAGLAIALSRPENAADKTAASKDAAPPVDTATGRTFENPFHHATEGDWVMLETTPVLKEQKFVSWRTELMDYLVREVPAGTVLRIKSCDVRWKEVDVMHGDTVVATGWVDGEKAPGKPAPK